jgi:hypothetical protein
MIISCLTFPERTGPVTKGIDRRHDIQVFEAIVEALRRVGSSREEAAWKHSQARVDTYFGRSRLVVSSAGGLARRSSTENLVFGKISPSPFPFPSFSSAFFGKLTIRNALDSRQYHIKLIL